MAISEVTVKNATLLASDQINASGGVLGKNIEPLGTGTAPGMFVNVDPARGDVGFVDERQIDLT